MVVFGGRDNWNRLVRNHKLRSGTYFTDYPVRDVNSSGWTTAIEFNSPTGAIEEKSGSLAVTTVNFTGV